MIGSTKKKIWNDTNQNINKWLWEVLISFCVFIHFPNFSVNEHEQITFVIKTKKIWGNPFEAKVILEWEDTLFQEIIKV